MTQGPKKRSRSARPARPAPRMGKNPRAKKAPHRRLLVPTVAVFASLLLCVAVLWVWGRGATSTNTNAPFRAVELPANLEAPEVLERLHEAGFLEQAHLTRAYQMVLHPWFTYTPGVHWLQPGQSVERVLSLVARTRARPIVRVVLPEGWDSFQMAERLATAGVCDARTFLTQARIAVDANALAVNSTAQRSLEGHLYPASYDLRLNSSASEVVERLNREANTRFQRVFAAQPDQAARLERELGLDADGVVTLASIVEKEAAHAGELGLVASVFLNRLRDPNFRPARMLQSDPTAAYGCKVYTALASCAAFTGRVSPLMLRDPRNPFNTYRLAGLPPTPIGNPSTASVEAVLNAPPTNYYFFVSPDGGPHRFSQTLEAHEAATRSQ